VEPRKLPEEIYKFQGSRTIAANFYIESLLLQPMLKLLERVWKGRIRKGRDNTDRLI